MVYKMNQSSQQSVGQQSVGQQNKENLNLLLVDPSLSEYYKARSNYNTDSGYDLYCPETVIIPPYSVGTLDFKIRCSPNFQKVSGYYLYPRSSISKTPLMVTNSVGIIDYGYRGNIMAKVFNVSSEAYEVKKGERLFQLCMPSLEPFGVVFVNELDIPEQGTGGFGLPVEGNKLLFPLK